MHVFVVFIINPPVPQYKKILTGKSDGRQPDLSLVEGRDVTNSTNNDKWQKTKGLFRYGTLLDCSTYAGIAS